MKTIDLNCDMGEGFGPYRLGDDEEMFSIVSSVNLACGFHAGDPVIMGRLFDLARSHQVAIGAHPGYPDLWGFGRREMTFSDQAIKDMLAYQIGAATGVGRLHDVTMTHIKIHGALAHAIANNEHLIKLYLDVHRKLVEDLYITVMATSMFERVAEAAKVKVAREIFADRAYQADGRLMPRDQPGAVISDPEQAAEHVLTMLENECLLTHDQQRIPTRIDTVCVHSDTPSAVEIARVVRHRLESCGYAIAPLSSATL